MKELAALSSVLRMNGPLFTDNDAKAETAQAAIAVAEAAWPQKRSA